MWYGEGLFLFLCILTLTDGYKKHLIWFALIGVSPLYYDKFSFLLLSYSLSSCILSLCPLVKWSIAKGVYISKGGAKLKKTLLCCGFFGVRASGDTITVSGYRVLGGEAEAIRSKVIMDG